MKKIVSRFRGNDERKEVYKWQLQFVCRAAAPRSGPITGSSWRTAATPRDGRFIEKVGTYNPLLAKDSPERVKLDADRIQHWLSVGAQPSDRVLRFLDAAGIRERAARNNPQKARAGREGQGAGRSSARQGSRAAEAAAAPKEEAAAAPGRSRGRDRRGSRGSDRRADRLRPSGCRGGHRANAAPPKRPAEEPVAEEATLPKLPAVRRAAECGRSAG